MQLLSNLLCHYYESSHFRDADLHSEKPAFIHNFLEDKESMLKLTPLSLAGCGRGKAIWSTLAFGDVLRMSLQTGLHRLQMYGLLDMKQSLQARKLFWWSWATRGGGGGRRVGFEGYICVGCVPCPWRKGNSLRLFLGGGSFKLKTCSCLESAHFCMLFCEGFFPLL